MKNRDMTKKLTKLIVNGVEYGFKEAIKPITSAWIYRNAQLGVISLSSDGSTWLTIADKNLWATTVYNDGDTLSQANCGNYYQWWNNYGFPFTWAVTTSSTQVDASTYWPWNYYSSSTFITRNGSPQNWDSTVNSNLWWWVTWTVAAMQWPCPTGFHVPSKDELTTLLTTINNIWITSWTYASKYLRIPFAGEREIDTWNTTYQGSYTYILQAIQHSGGNLATLLISNANLEMTYSLKSTWLSIRPFANTPIQPDSSWEKLY